MQGIVSLALFLLVSLAHGDSNENERASLLDLMAELRDLQAAVMKLGEVSVSQSKELTAARSAVSAVEARLQAGEGQVASLSTMLAQQGAVLGEQAVQIAATRSSVTELSGRLEANVNQTEEQQAVLVDLRVKLNHQQMQLESTRQQMGDLRDVNAGRVT